MPRRAAPAALPLPDLVVLVLQGGGALGAFQAGVYEAMIDLGIELDKGDVALRGLVRGDHCGQPAR